MGGFIDMVDALAKEVEKEKMKVNVQFKIIKLIICLCLASECCLLGDIRFPFHIHMNITSLCQNLNLESSELKVVIRMFSKYFRLLAQEIF